MQDFLQFTAKFSETDQNTKAILEAMKVAMDNEILIGVPDDKSGRGGEVSNAELVFIHTNGSPINGIPARPIIEPAIEHDKEKVSSLLQRVANAVLTGNKQSVSDAQERAGMQGANIAKAWFTNPANGWAADSDDTIKRKGSAAPLIDTGEMRKSITYKIRRA